jgi:hypothetical protein
MPTLAAYSNAASDVFPGGQSILICQIETYVNSGEACSASGVTITIAASGASDGGSGTPVPATSTGITEQGMGLYQYVWSVPEDQDPGSYLVTWTGVRSSDSTSISYVQAINVAPNPESVPLPGLYASVADYRNRTNDQNTPAARVQVALQLASEDIDRALIAAVYRTDADGMPLDPQLVNVLRRATAAQAQYVIDVGDDSDVKREYASTSIAGLSQTRAPSMQGNALRPICTQALGILHVSGVLPSAPLINW